MIKDFTFYLPVKIIFGQGSFERVGEEASLIGKKALIVTGRSSTKKNGLLLNLQSQLEEKKIDWVLYDHVRPNPTNVIVDEGARIARERSCDFVIGLGGGSALDAAKAIALSAKSGLPIWRHIASWEEDYVKPEEALPILAIETLAGTGSESDNISVVTNVATNEKPGFASPLMFPRTAIVDPLVLLTVPKRMTAITGFDILCHTVEGYVSRVSHPVCEILNERAMEYVVEYLPEALKDEKDLDSRGYLAFANILAGISLTHSRATLLHAMEHPLSGYFGITHAEGLAALFPKWLEFSYDGYPERFKRIGSIFGLTGSDNTKENLLEKVKDFLKDIELDVKLSELGVRLDDPRVLARDSIKYMGGGVKNNPVEADVEDIVRILEASM